MAPTRRNTTASVKKSDTAASASNENNALSPATRKRGRPPTKKAAVAKADVAKADAVKNTNKEGNGDQEEAVKELHVSEKKQEHEEPVVKRKRGRPAKLNSDGTKKSATKQADPSIPKRGRGRPRKIAAE
ncbi:hypothetical protein MAM1_0182c07423 [Mucor ambiguus]|uniref:Uncharacterized protein n=1 Tax=Mucor ambiguus TaxID=91626 RepID=A0A0C9N021_9FUNG|nr:hypothetical protein MAM1_0182c07423 [Mucor ambiguus]